ncbi:MAG: ABC transporter ATP-binding protein [Hyphomicrobiales bacterium]
MVARGSAEGIVLNEVAHVYPGERMPLRILDGISLRIGKGEFLALIGPSGCGKTTILDILSGLVPLQSGTMLVGGRPPAAGRPDTARMFARDALLPWRTAFSNIEFAVSSRPHAQAGRKLIGPLLQAVGLEGFENSYPRQLSQGMRQRVALARTFSLESEFLFLDEPFGALDAQTKLLLQDKLLELWERHRSTVVLVSHDLGEAIALADRVVVMSGRPGRIIADLPIDIPRPRSVRALQKERAYHDLYARLWDELERASAPAAPRQR